MNARDERKMEKVAAEEKARQRLADDAERDRMTRAIQALKAERERGAMLDVMTDDERHAFLKAERAAGEMS